MEAIFCIVDILFMKKNTVKKTSETTSVRGLCYEDALNVAFENMKKVIEKEQSFWHGLQCFYTLASIMHRYLESKRMKSVFDARHRARPEKTLEEILTEIAKAK